MKKLLEVITHPVTYSQLTNYRFIHNDRVLPIHRHIIKWR